MKKIILINIPKDNFNYPDIKKYQNKQLNGKLVEVKFYDYDDNSILAKLV